MGAFEERAAENETLFRTVNEEIERLGQVGAGSSRQLTAFVCECSEGTCTERVHLTLAEYEEVRAQSRWFAIVPGHLTDEIEHMVRSTERYAIVQKDTPRAAEIADISDPRD